MKSIRTGLTSHSLAICLVAAIVEALHQTRGPTIIYFLKSIVDDLAERPHTAARLEILKMFMGNLLTFITEKPDELQASITLIRDSISRLPTAEQSEQQTRSARPSRRSRSLRFDNEEEEHVAGMDRHLAKLTKAYEESLITELAERAQHMQNGFTVFMLSLIHI